jgi:hypothetical protein
MVFEHHKDTEDSDVIIIILVNVGRANRVIPRTMVQEEWVRMQLARVGLLGAMNLRTT